MDLMLQNLMLQNLVGAYLFTRKKETSTYAGVATLTTW